MNFGRAILALGAPRTFAEAIGELRGRGSQWLAGHLGIPARTARYYLSGAREPNPRTAVGRQRRQAVMDAVDRAGRLRIAARALRQARTLSVGRVKVATKSKDKPDGSRSIGTVLVDGEARSERIEPPSSLEEVADICFEGIKNDVFWITVPSTAQSEKIQARVAIAKDANDIDAACNLAATSKRLMALVGEAASLCVRLRAERGSQEGEQND